MNEKLLPPKLTRERDMLISIDSIDTILPIVYPHTFELVYNDFIEISFKEVKDSYRHHHCRRRDMRLSRSPFIVKDTLESISAKIRKAEWNGIFRSSLY